MGSTSHQTAKRRSMQTEQVATQSQKLLTVRQFSQSYNWPTESALRAYIFRAEQYGLREAFFRIGKRVLIDPVVFFKKIKEQSKSQSEGDHHVFSETPQPGKPRF